jgi:hypothetical protein
MGKVGIEAGNNSANVNKRIEVHASNNPVLALSEFKSNFYDRILLDINICILQSKELMLCEQVCLR